MSSPYPEHLHTVTPRLVVEGAADAIEFYRRAFGAQEIGERFAGPDGAIIHAEVRIGDSVVMLSDDPGEDSSPARSPAHLGGERHARSCPRTGRTSIRSGSVRCRRGRRCSIRSGPVLRRAQRAPARPLRPAVDAQRTHRGAHGRGHRPPGPGGLKASCLGRSSGRSRAGTSDNAPRAGSSDRGARAPAWRADEGPTDAAPHVSASAG